MFQRKFRSADITIEGIRRSIVSYQNAKNGLFYSRTYKEILKIFSEASIPLRVALVFSWMVGQYRPALSNIEKLELSFKFPRFEHLTLRNIGIIGNAFAIAEAELGSIAASKYLHFLAPNTFMMWDNKIQAYVFGKKLSSKGNRLRYERFCLELCQKYKRSKLRKKYLATYTAARLVDIWLWVRA